MKKLTRSILVAFFFTTQSNVFLAQESNSYGFKLEAKVNTSNKKRSYAVYNDDRYANTGYFGGYDLGFYYQHNFFDYGIEYFSPYNHINASLGYTGLKFLREIPDFNIIPDVKLGYTPVLDKIYYGFGLSFRYKWFTAGYDKILHVKSGSSKGHGDGLDVFSIGLSWGIRSNSK
ncbi:MAG: hypothetical protein ABF242_03440 [Flavobacteriales bacterium]